MTDTAIQIEQLSKRYRVGAQRQAYTTLREALTGGAKASLQGLSARVRSGQRSASGPDMMWALRDVSLDVNRGEAVGIVGNNGAGKSTLLKILTRITEPSSGRAVVDGRVGALLEVGTGFHTELTGRENIYLNGAILGLTRRDIRQRFDEIVSFSGIDRYLDTQVKYYSTGMRMRLAFAVAAHLEPDILFIDEVLAVGDAEFQRKCLGKMDDISQEGRTLLFVSHNMIALQNLCKRAVWIQQGRVVDIGDSRTVVSRYIQEASTFTAQRVWDDVATAPGNDTARLQSVSVIPHFTPTSQNITLSTPIDIEIRFWNLKAGARLNASLHVYTSAGILAFNPVSNANAASEESRFPPGLHALTCHIPGGLLNDETYSVEVMLVENSVEVLCKVSDAVVFEVQDDSARAGWYGKWAGVVRPDLTWTSASLE